MVIVYDAYRYIFDINTTTNTTITGNAGYVVTLQIAYKYFETIA